MAKKKDQRMIVIAGYVDKLVIERRVVPAGAKWHSDAIISLSNDETDDLFAMLPQAILERERAKKANRPKGTECFSGEI